MKSRFNVKKLGNCKIPSPLKLSKVVGDDIFDYILDSDRVLYDQSLDSFKKHMEKRKEPLSFEKAGPREFLCFDPNKTKAGIVTCGGLCPGLNDVIRSLVMVLHYRYGVRDIFGFRYGYAGMVKENGFEPEKLTPKEVLEIHKLGGTILGSSRGNQDVHKIVDYLNELEVNVLFCIGGDGTLKGAMAIAEEAEKRKTRIAVVGIPKTIDNDINLIERSFGFETAFSQAGDIIRYAHNEATGAYNGIALLKLMGRDSGFIAAHAALSVQEVNFVLIPEMRFELYGENGFLEVLRKRLEASHHAVIVVSEGAGQYFFDESKGKDESGNTKYKDIGLFLKEKINEYFKEIDFQHTIKYIDPSYIIRSAPANANDSKFCSQLAQNAVHAAMAGKTNCVVGYWNNQFTLIPIAETVKSRKKIELESYLWYNVLEATGQPVKM